MLVQQPPKNVYRITGSVQPLNHTHTHTLYLVNEADGGCLATVQEVHVDDLQLLQTDVEGLQLAILPVQRDHLEQSVVQAQPDHAALRVHNTNDARLRRAANAVLMEKEGRECMAKFQKTAFFGEH